MNITAVLTYAMEIKSMFDKENNIATKEAEEKFSMLNHCYLETLNIISVCADEIGAKAAKTKGGSEPKRRKAAKEIMTKDSYCHSYAEGYKRLDNGKIMLMNSMMGYIGMPIEGICESSHPEKFPDISQFFNQSSNCITERINVSEIATKYKLAQAEGKINKWKKINLYLNTDNAVYHIGDSYFNAELILRACDILGAEDIKVSIDNGKFKPCILASEYGKCVVTPFNRKRDSQ